MMFNSINLEKIYNFTDTELTQVVTGLAEHIDKNLGFKVEESSLKILNETCPPSLAVLEGFRTVAKVAIEKGLYVSLENRLIVINKLCQEIIVAHPCKVITEYFSKDNIVEALSNCDPKQIALLGTVAKSWHEASLKSQIMAINSKHVKLKELLNGFTAKMAVDWLIKNPDCTSLEYANFNGFVDFDNECLEKLTNSCTNLKHLFLEKTIIKDDALKNLEKTKELHSLDISFCEQLETDALKHLQHTLELQNLDISFCEQLETDALKHLHHHLKLQNFQCGFCHQLELHAGKYPVLKLNNSKNSLITKFLSNVSTSSKTSFMSTILSNVTDPTLK